MDKAIDMVASHEFDLHFPFMRDHLHISGFSRNSCFCLLSMSFTCIFHLQEIIYAFLDLAKIPAFGSFPWVWYAFSICGRLSVHLWIQQKLLLLVAFFRDYFSQIFQAWHDGNHHWVLYFDTHLVNWISSHSGFRILGFCEAKGLTVLHFDTHLMNWISSHSGIFKIYHTENMQRRW